MKIADVICTTKHDLQPVDFKAQLLKKTARIWNITIPGGIMYLTSFRTFSTKHYSPQVTNSRCT